MLVFLGTLVSSQTKGTQATAESITQIPNYCATHPDAQIRFVYSGMYLHLHTNASYLSKFKTISCAGRQFFLSNKFPALINKNEPYSPP